MNSCGRDFSPPPTSFNCLQAIIPSLERIGRPLKLESAAQADLKLNKHTGTRKVGKRDTERYYKIYIYIYYTSYMVCIVACYQRRTAQQILLSASAPRSQQA